MAVVSQKHLENTHRLGGSFRLSTAIFILKIHVLLAALALASVMAVESAVAALIDLKIQLREH